MKSVFFVGNWSNRDKKLSKVLILFGRILDVLKESEKLKIRRGELKVGQKWTVIVTPKADGTEGYLVRLRRTGIPHWLVDAVMLLWK